MKKIFIFAMFTVSIFVISLSIHNVYGTTYYLTDQVSRQETDN